jgi:hypothetical protein
MGVCAFSNGCDSRPGVQSAFFHFRRDTPCGEWRTRIRQPRHDPDKHAELDRDKVGNFQVHFAKPLYASIKMTETEENYSLKSLENLALN